MPSVSPPPDPVDGDGGEPHSREPHVIDDPEQVDMEKALLSEPIVGVDKIILDEHGPGALPATPLPSPRSMTPAQKAIHDLTHLPYHSGCPICVSTRRPNSGHYKSHEHIRVITFSRG